MKVFHPVLNDATEPNPVETVAFRRNRWCRPRINQYRHFGRRLQAHVRSTAEVGLLQKENLPGTTSLSINALALGMERTIRATYVGFLY
jgi:hypothetical protein